MSNPNNCATCDHKKYPDGGHCYMFKDEPNQACGQHTARPAYFIHWASVADYLAEFKALTEVKP